MSDPVDPLRERAESQDARARLEQAIEPALAAFADSDRGITIAELSEMVRAARAYLNATAWQPMESAPKSGYFLVNDGRDNVPVVAHRMYGWEGFCSRPGRYRIANPIGWMPLPPAPASRG